ncbi:MAG: hypothetical protein GQ552_07260 [Flavobacteriaceae bacterium]|nr:hypothetical protein [Flavobacteriaceae bacterium]
MRTNYISKKKSNNKLNYFLISFCILIAFTGFSQEVKKTTSNWDLGASVQSRYIWRGINLGGNSASIQPSIAYSTGMFTIGAWGAYSIGSDQVGQEADLYITIAPLDFLSFTVTDYFFPVERAGSNGYFGYGDKTGHVFEAMATFSPNNFPVSFMVATNFAGADKDENGNQSFSTYLEASYGISAGIVDINLFAGAVIGDSGGYYGTDGSGFINLGLGASKAIKITESWSLPVDAALIYNPDAENIFITFGFTL